MYGSMTAFEVAGKGPARAAALRQAIWNHRIEVPVIERPDRLLLRVSTHFYNTTEEIDRLAEVLPAVLQEVGG
jgi:isopenicillin-N epimerase